MHIRTQKELANFYLSPVNKTRRWYETVEPQRMKEIFSEMLASKQIDDLTKKRVRKAIETL